MKPGIAIKSQSQSIRDQLLFWGILIGTFTFIQFFKDGNSEAFYTIFLQNSRRLPAMILVAYGFNDFLLPRYYRPKHYVLFLIGTALLFYIGGILDRVINIYIYEPLFREGTFEQESLLEIMMDIYFLVGSYIPPLLTAALIMTVDRMIRRQHQMERAVIQLERDKKIAELRALKAQIHPHFLFNTLNNLYALTLKKSDKAPETVATLSAMLDYMLYQCNDRLVPLEKEVTLLEHYMALEQLRYGDEIDIAFAKAYTPTTQIAPLILLSMVENAFKHGASGALERPKIEITLTQEAERLYVKVRNTKPLQTTEDPMQYTKGIGVPNIKQQIALLYPDFSYDVQNENGWYTVTLMINTAYVID